MDGSSASTAPATDGSTAAWVGPVVAVVVLAVVLAGFAVHRVRSKADDSDSDVEAGAPHGGDDVDSVYLHAMPIQLDGPMYSTGASAVPPVHQNQAYDTAANQSVNDSGYAVVGEQVTYSTAGEQTV